MRILIAFFFVFTFYACDCSKKACCNKSQAEQVQNDTLARLSVSFYSRGGGSDRAARTKFNSFIAEYDLNNKTKLAYDVVPWGREGEVEYCFKLKELNDDQKVTFISEAKEVLKSFTLVRFSENVACRKSRY